MKIYVMGTHYKCLSEPAQSQGPSNENPQHVFSRRKMENIYLGPVVQSVVSLMSSLWVISLTVLADSLYNILIFFTEKI